MTTQFTQPITDQDAESVLRVDVPPERVDLVDLAQLVQGVRAAFPPGEPTPTPVLHALLAGGGPQPGVLGSSGPRRSPVRRLAAWAAGLGLGAQLALGAGVAAAVGAGVGIAGYLPGPAQQLFDRVVGVDPDALGNGVSPDPVLRDRLEPTPLEADATVPEPGTDVAGDSPADDLNDLPGGDEPGGRTRRGDDGEESSGSGHSESGDSDDEGELEQPERRDDDAAESDAADDDAESDLADDDAADDDAAGDAEEPGGSEEPDAPEDADTPERDATAGDADGADSLERDEAPTVYADPEVDAES